MKEKIHAHCLEKVQEKLEMLAIADKEAQQSANNETKSSAGDKYETGRAMMHLEKERIAMQAMEWRKLKKVLDQIDPHKTSETIGLGSLVRLNDLIYYLAISLGEVHVEEKAVFTISPVSPIGKLITGKSVGESIHWQGKPLAINEVF